MSMPRRTLMGVFVAICTCAALVGCSASRRPEEFSKEGLRRVPSRANGGVFREPNWPFSQYQRFVLEPLTVSFVEDWERQHPEVSDREIKRIREEAAKLFREQFEKELIEKGKYGFATEPDPDVLIVAPTLTDLDISAPDTEEMRKQSYAMRSISMRITAELRDAASGRLVGRVDMFSPSREYGAHELRPVTRASNAHEVSVAIRQWAQLFREALDVAKNEKKETKLE
jgi:uncharacterized protein DUF3313